MHMGKSSRTLKLLAKIICFFTFIALASCSSPDTVQPTDSATPPPATFTPTSSPELPVLTLTPIPTEIPVPLCANNGLPVKASKDFKVNGEILLQSSDNHEIVAISGNQSSVSPIVRTDPGYIAFLGLSPNGKWLTYALQTSADSGYINPTFQVILLSESGEKIENTLTVAQFENLFMDYVFDGVGGNYWINDKLIQLYLLLRNPSPFATGTPRLLSVILDPFNGKWEANPLSDRIQIDGVTIEDLDFNFSPDLSKALYQQKYKVVLKDMNDQREVWSTEDYALAMPRTKTRWSPDNKFVVIAERYHYAPNLTIVSSDGKDVRKLVFDDGFMDFEWSPNSQFLMLQYSRNAQTEFEMYDVSSDSFLFRCPIQGYPESLGVSFYWSPENDSIVFGTQLGFVGILDIKSRAVIQLAIAGFNPVGWSAVPFRK